MLYIIAFSVVCMGWLFLKDSYEFADPQFFWLLMLLPLVALYRWMNLGKHRVTIKAPSSQAFEQFGLPWKRWIQLLMEAGRIVALAALIMALARPQSSRSWEDRRTEGIDIIIAMDVSASMLAQDFKPNRLESSKEVAMEFINARPDDRIGLVVYEAEPFTQVPLTTDHTVLQRLFSQVKTGRLESGTAIGMGLATAVNRLKDSDSKSKVVILLSDGENNSGAIQPLDAASIARTFGVRVYTIGVGSSGYARTPVQIRADGSYVYDRVQVQIDEETLQAIADETGGRYFRATSAQKLERIYSEIDELEKTRIQVTEYSKRSEQYYPYALSGLIFIGFDLILMSLFFRTID
jgi:Ca-activated chloride channel family protein